MKPIAIFRFSPTEGPGYFATFLDEHGIPWQLFRVDKGESLPVTCAAFSGLCMMGGPMSVNDPLPWIPPLRDLIRAGIAEDIPVIGHCLGAQLMAKALGGSVSVNPVKEIGWHEVYPTDAPVARDWLGDRASLAVFQWHGETFSIPAGATRIASSEFCENQIFVLGKHLALQCHVEMTRELVESWCANGRREIDASNSPAVQSVDAMLANLDIRVAALNHLAADIYEHWIRGLMKS
ncbi:MAG: type 1 glutamine amidotransferase [Burkholderiales bacterium]|nr:type 1 glutamine amidotransferase [Burkholderiales bacterium]